MHICWSSQYDISYGACYKDFFGSQKCFTVKYPDFSTRWQPRTILIDAVCAAPTDCLRDWKQGTDCLWCPQHVLESNRVFMFVFSSEDDRQVSNASCWQSTLVIRRANSLVLAGEIGEVVTIPIENVLCTTRVQHKSNNSWVNMSCNVCLRPLFVSSC